MASTLLMAAGRRLQEAEKARELAMLDLRRAVVKAFEEGNTIVAITRWAGVSRPTVYAILKEAGLR